MYIYLSVYISLHVYILIGPSASTATAEKCYTNTAKKIEQGLVVAGQQSKGGKFSLNITSIRISACINFSSCLVIFPGAAILDQLCRKIEGNGGNCGEK